MPLHSARVTLNKMLAPGVFLLKLALEERNHFDFRAGQFLITHPPRRAEDAKPPKGFYSIASAEQAKELSLLVEHRPSGGYVSAWMTERQSGDLIDVEGPLGKFTQAEDGAGPLAYFCSKVGLAPCRSLCLSSLNRGSTLAHHLFLGGQGEDLLFDREWRELMQAKPNFHYHPGGDAAAQALASLPRSGARSFLAGFNREVEPLQAALLAAGFEAAAMHVEKFG